MHLSAEEEWCLMGEGGAADGEVGAAVGEVDAADGEGGVARGQEGCGERRGCRVELLKGGGTGPLLTQVFSWIRGARLLSSQLSPRLAREMGKRDNLSSKFKFYKILISTKSHACLKRGKRILQVEY